MVFSFIHNPSSLPSNSRYWLLCCQISLLTSATASTWFLGLQGSDQDREDLQGRLRLAETRAEELAENLRAATSSMEQYRAMAQSLEESLDREKQVQKKLQNCLSACHVSVKAIDRNHQND